VRGKACTNIVNVVSDGVQLATEGGLLRHGEIYVAGIRNVLVLTENVLILTRRRGEERRATTAL
jgi:hypothetical protein